MKRSIITCIMLAILCGTALFVLLKKSFAVFLMYWCFIFLPFLILLVLYNTRKEKRISATSHINNLTRRQAAGLLERITDNCLLNEETAWQLTNIASCIRSELDCMHTWGAPVNLTKNIDGTENEFVFEPSEYEKEGKK